MLPETCRKLQVFVILVMLSASEGRRVLSRILLSASQLGDSGLNSDGDAEEGVGIGPEHEILLSATYPNIEQEPLMDAINGELTEVIKGEASSLVEVSRKFVPPPKNLIPKRTVTARTRAPTLPSIGADAQPVIVGLEPAPSPCPWRRVAAMRHKARPALGELQRRGPQLFLGSMRSDAQMQKVRPQPVMLAGKKNRRGKNRRPAAAMPAENRRGKKVRPAAAMPAAAKPEILTNSVALPPDWAEATDDEGRIYYWNKVTRETRWTMPDDVQMVPELPFSEPALRPPAEGDLPYPDEPKRGPLAESDLPPAESDLVYPDEPKISLPSFEEYSRGPRKPPPQTETYQSKSETYQSKLPPIDRPREGSSEPQPFDLEKVVFRTTVGAIVFLILVEIIVQATPLFDFLKPSPPAS